MIPAPNLREIIKQLEYVRLDPWGPDGVRYVCVLFWDYHGYRYLTNQIDRQTWERWHWSSGQFWDLFLAGCYSYGPRDCYGDRGLPLTPEGPNETPFYWSQFASEDLAREMAQESHHSGIPPWRFSGPLELVAVGARRNGREVDIDWPGLRSAKVPANALSAAVSDYTEAHVTLDADLVPDSLPSPGDFQDTLPSELKDDLLKHIGLLKFLFHH
ncbi:hypothetical protein [Streptomyces atratus]|uniref:hypothetical protein n=1 Tax=Streptomyces atratus TaxID=1893 RepID=UPI00224CAD06|nr:hypothetical protein [Streptomyces atratus]MCX5345882.1 hypothetical protein [Streptomyces atratus]